MLILDPVAWIEAAIASDTDDCLEWPFSRDRKGYPFGTVDGHQIRVHRHVLQAVKPRGHDSGPWALHSCDNPPCANPRHLRWGTAAENTADAIERGRLARGVRTGTAKLTDELVAEIRATYRAGGVTYQDVASRFGVAVPTIADVVTGRYWKHVADEQAGWQRPEYRPRGERANFAKVNEDQVREIRRLRAEGATYVAIGARFGLHHTTVSDIVRRQTWGHVG